MKIYNYSEARQNFASILNSSLKEEVVIARKDGSKFRIVPIIETESKSPFDVQGINSKIKTNEIINIIREFREGE
ncbi:MAG: type II toxin-antitoxin system Phd/YefM family antitoxin [Spirochaetes bacterium]|nr:type II toxin-antitoxin system Phd/YefM family antitoxin [Spirochaetota bacterium]